MALRHQPLPLLQLLPAGAKGFAVLDLETTGTGQLCRIVEIALLLLSPEGEIEQEWSTVINPGVPIPNAAVHGIDERLAAAAPSFPAVASTLAALLEGRALAALLRHGLTHLHPSRVPVRVAGISGSELEPPPLLLRSSTSRKGFQQSHD